MLRRSPSGVSAGKASAWCLRTGRLSPVSAASLVARRWASNTRASAATGSPGLSSSTSPTTTSRASMVSGCPSRSTVACRGPSLRRLETVCSARRSVTKPSVALAARTAPIAPASASARVASAMPAEAPSKPTGTELNWPSRICPALRPVMSRISLGPSRASRSAAAAAPRPCFRWPGASAAAQARSWRIGMACSASPASAAPTSACAAACRLGRPRCGVAAAGAAASSRRRAARPSTNCAAQRSQ